MFRRPINPRDTFTGGPSGHRPHATTTNVDSSHDNVSRLETFIEDLVSSILVGYSGRERLTDDAGFAQCTEHLVTPQSNVISGFARDSWNRVSPSTAVPSTAGQFIEL